MCVCVPFYLSVDVQCLERIAVIEHTGMGEVTGPGIASLRQRIEKAETCIFGKQVAKLIVSEIEARCKCIRESAICFVIA